MTITRKIRKAKALGCVAVLALCAIAMSPKAMASTVAYWPLAGENGVRTVSESSITGATVKPITIAGCTPTGTTYTGLLDEIRITKRALTVKEFMSPEYTKGLMLIFC